MMNRRACNLPAVEYSRSTLAERLVQARTESGLGQDAVARNIGMSQQSYSDLETSKSKSTTKIGSLANLFGVDAYWLETGQGNMKRPRVGEDRLGYPVLPPREQARTPEERRILRVFRALNDQQRRGLLAVFEKGE